MICDSVFVLRNHAIWCITCFLLVDNTADSNMLRHNNANRVQTLVKHAEGSALGYAVLRPVSSAYSSSGMVIVPTTTHVIVTTSCYLRA